MDFRDVPIILTLLLFLPLPWAICVSDHSTLVYKTCATQNLNRLQSQSYFQTLDSLFAQLIGHSSQSSFFKTTVIGEDGTAMSGLFQCREDLSREECFECVNLLPQMCSALCGHSVGARVQLEGCYAQYESEGISESDETNSDEVLHEACEGEGYGKVIREVMEGAFEALQSEVEKSENGFYRGSYESVEMMAQCEGDIDACGCGECVSHAAEVAEYQCSGSLSAQIYLPNCFISYVYHAHSFPGENNSSSSNAQRSAAIVVGGVVALIVVLIFLFFLKSRYTKDDFD